MLCKVINSSNYNLEKDINDWLSTGKYEIINIFQTQNDLFVTTTIFYLDIKEVREKKIKKLNGK
jgi:hypothetical protein